MVFCTNCQSEIEDSKMFLHEGFCKKNIRYCFKCKEKIPIEEYEEHLEDHKVPTKSDAPKKEEEKIKTEEVKGRECAYCSMYFDNSEIDEHEEMCGARTIQCEICGEFILTRLMNQHMNVIHDSGYKIKKCQSRNVDEENERMKRKQIEDDEIFARKLEEEYRRYDMNNGRNDFFRQF